MSETNYDSLYWTAWQVVHNRLDELPKNGKLDPDMEALRRAVQDTLLSKGTTHARD